MPTLIKFLVDHSTELLGIAYLLVNLLNAVAQLTPTQRDNKIAKVIHSVLDRISFLAPAGAKGTLKMPLMKSKPMLPEGDK